MVVFTQLVKAVKRKSLQLELKILVTVDLEEAVHYFDVNRYLNKSL